jgi:hypothetical protein
MRCKKDYLPARKRGGNYGSGDKEKGSATEDGKAAC